MKAGLIVTFIFFTGFFISMNQCISQSDSANDLSDSIMLQYAREIIKEAGNCTLITRDENGIPAARIMDPFIPDEDFTIWFGTNPLSRKVKQIQQDSTVLVIYHNKEKAEYVSIIGYAKMVNDPGLKKRYWKEGWDAFYPDRNDSFTLIRFTPKSIEISSAIKGVTGNKITWAVPSIDLNQ